MSLNTSQESPAQGLTLAAARSEGSPPVAKLFKHLLLQGAVAYFRMFSLRGKSALASVEGLIHRNTSKPTAAQRIE